MCAFCCALFSIISSTGFFLAVAWCNDILLRVLLVLRVYVCARALLHCRFFSCILCREQWTERWLLLFQNPRHSVRWWPYGDEIKLFHSVLLGLSYSRSIIEEPADLQSSPVPLFRSSLSTFHHQKSIWAHLYIVITKYQSKWKNSTL